MTSEQNTAVVLRGYREMVDGQQLELAGELLAPDFTGIFSGAPEPVRGQDAFRQFISGFITAFPDLHHDIEQVVTEGDTVVVRTTARGTHKGPLLDILPPTGRSMSIDAIAFFKLHDGRVSEQHVTFDLAGMMAQLTA